MIGRIPLNSIRFDSLMCDTCVPVLNTIISDQVNRLAVASEHFLSRVSFAEILMLACQCQVFISYLSNFFHCFQIIHSGKIRSEFFCHFFLAKICSTL